MMAGHNRNKRVVPAGGALTPFGSYPFCSDSGSSIASAHTQVKSGIYAPAFVTELVAAVSALPRHGIFSGGHQEHTINRRADDGGYPSCIKSTVTRSERYPIS